MRLAPPCTEPLAMLETRLAPRRLRANLVIYDLVWALEILRTGAPVFVVPNRRRFSRALLLNTQRSGCEGVL
jgi:hypothetical protein